MPSLPPFIRCSQFSRTQFVLALLGLTLHGAICSPAQAETKISVFPAMGAENVSPDTPLKMTFSGLPVPEKLVLRIIDVASGETLETIDQSVKAQSQSIGGIPRFNYSPTLVTGNQLEVFPAHHLLSYGKTYEIRWGVGPPTEGDSKPDSRFDWKFTTRSAPPAMGAPSYVVAADGSGDFNTVQGALDFLPAGNTSPVTILVRAGTYHELLCLVGKHNVTLLGESRSNTIIACANNANFSGAQNVPAAQVTHPAPAVNQNTGVSHRGLFIAARCNNLTVANLTLHNLTPQGGSQAESIILNNNPQARAILTHCDLDSFQDTLQINGQAYISDCHIKGDVDFMWGNGPCYFQNCELVTLRSRAYYTQIRNRETNHGYVYHQCLFTGAPGVTDNVLSRIDPGRFPASEVVLLDCTLTSAVSPAAWRLDMSQQGPNVHFWEYNSRDPSGQPVDVSQRHAVSRQLKLPEDRELIDNYRNPVWVLGGEWNPREAAIFDGKVTLEKHTNQ